MKAERYMMFVYMSVNMFNCLMIRLCSLIFIETHLRRLLIAFNSSLINDLDIFLFSLSSSLFSFSFLASSNILHFLKSSSTTYEYLAHVVTHLWYDSVSSSSTFSNLMLFDSLLVVPAIESQISYLVVDCILNVDSEAVSYYNFDSDIRCRITRAFVKAQENEVE